MAGGLELALWCDLRVAAEDAVFGVFCRRFGVPLCRPRHRPAAPDRGPRAGHGPHPHRARRRAVRGAAMGLANRVVPPGGARRPPWRGPRARRPPPGCAYARPASALEQWDLPVDEAPPSERPGSGCDSRRQRARRSRARRVSHGGVGPGRRRARPAPASEGRADMTPDRRRLRLRRHADQFRERVPFL